MCIMAIVEARHSHMCLYISNVFHCTHAAKLRSLCANMITMLNQFYLLQAACLAVDTVYSAHRCNLHLIALAFLLTTNLNL
jgi:hypothetical protein